MDEWTDPERLRESLKPLAGVSKMHHDDIDAHNDLESKVVDLEVLASTRRDRELKAMIARHEAQGLELSWLLWACGVGLGLWLLGSAIVIYLVCR